MKHKAEESRLWAKYKDDCNDLWIDHNRSATSEPTE